MKYKFLSVFVFIIGFASSAQEAETTMDDSQPTNEIKVNGLFLVVGAFDVTYEYLLNEESGLGLNVFIPYDEDIKDDINYYISPYYRFYFGNKYAAGFFIEGFGMLNSINETTYDYTPLTFDAPVIVREERLTDFALGIGVGGKWVTNGGFIGELNFGIGRNLFSSNDEGEEFVGKLGLTLGYRF